MNADGELGSADVAFLVDQATAAVPLRSSEEGSGLTYFPNSFTYLADLLDGVVCNPAAAATALLTRFGSLGTVLSAHERQLAETTSMTARGARLLRAAYAATMFALREQVAAGHVIANRQDLERWLKAEVAYRKGAWSVALLLNRRNVVIREQTLAGTLSVDRTHVLRTILAAVLDADAAAVIVACNTLDDDATLSPNYYEGARLLAGSLGSIGVALHDYIIVGRNRVTSGREKGLF